ncbi:MAG TPA: hypothetical protein VNI83_16310 [Vicinamibacterales bacterium]|nr:hypothetical protein [Vicinamibacterales bacterium]
MRVSTCLRFVARSDRKRGRGRLWPSGARAGRRLGAALGRSLAAALLVAACGAPTRPSPPAADFLVDVDGERFVLRLTDPETIRRADEQLRGVRSGFPLGPLRQGDGGFNRPWSWHLDPSETRLVEAAIEVCDGRPSYVERHRDAFPVYCPWGAKIVARR